MRFRRYWPEMLLSLTVALPWLSLIALGGIWLWQSGNVWAWSIAAALLGLLAWPLSKSVQRRANEEARFALGDLAEPSRGWNVVEREAWTEVLAIADATPPFTFAQMEPLVASARDIVEVVARRFHPEAHAAWAQFSLPELLLLVERLCRDVRREALRHIPAVRAIRLSHLLWVQQQNQRYGTVARTGWRMGFGLWRIVRAALNPLQAIGQETSGMFMENTAQVLSYRLRAHATRLLVLEIGRASIELYAGRLALSDEEIGAARERDMAGIVDRPAPVRIVLMGQVNAGKSSLLNALAREVRSAAGPTPVTSSAAEYLLELEGHPTVVLVDMPGLDERTESAAELQVQAERADLMVWVVSATQPARGPDRKWLDEFRAWANAQLARRPPSVLVALTHIDELRPAAEWAPPYDVIAPTAPKARAIRAAVDAAARALDLRVDAIVPIAMPSGRESYNVDSLWARIAVELDEAKLVQLDRLRVGQQGLRLQELADQLGQAGRTIIKGILKV
ncbi:MAG TPA: GTPase [Xanthobacteraceae bacterium]|nr:GTPase [Xanthobacteraceae bacterium]